MPYADQSNLEVFVPCVHLFSCKRRYRVVGSSKELRNISTLKSGTDRPRTRGKSVSREERRGGATVRQVGRLRGVKFRVSN